MPNPQHVLADCVEHMASMEPDSVDAVVCDPPYGIRFMGKAWDGAEIEEAARKREAMGPSASRLASGRTTTGFTRSDYAGAYDFSLKGAWAFQEWSHIWAVQALRVLKPGGHLVAFGGTRTHHRLMVALEDAGFEIRDTLMWLYGSGFPKSMDVSKAIDKAAGAERERNVIPQPRSKLHGDRPWMNDPDHRFVSDEPITEAAKQWDGWGTALKPAWEPIVLCRKPLSEHTVALNVLRWGTGAINVDGTRVGTDGGTTRSHQAPYGSSGWRTGHAVETLNTGRWPANLVLAHSPECVEVGQREVKGRTINRWDDGAKPFGGGAGHTYSSKEQGPDLVEEWQCAPDCAVRLLDEQSGESISRRHERTNKPGIVYGGGSGFPVHTDIYGVNDSGGASRFFYTAKVSPSERQQENGRSMHPTQKPVDLMRWLCRLVCPPNGLILDPFMGSGTTGVAALAEGFQFIGIEKEQEYYDMAVGREAQVGMAL